MRRTGTRFCAGLALVLVSAGSLYGAASDPAPGFPAIAYRNVEDTDPDQTYGGVSTLHLAEQFDWLKANGYHPVSIEDLIAARGGRPLPDKPVLLSFDEGWASFYTRVLPLLQAFGYPAVVCIAPARMLALAGTLVPYGDNEIPRDSLMSWDQARELARSGLVEIAVQANAADESRLGGDLTAAAEIIRRETGRAPRVVVWPARGMSSEATAIAAAVGMPIALTQETGNGSAGELDRIPRLRLMNDPWLGDFVDQLRTSAQSTPVR